MIDDLADVAKRMGTGFSGGLGNTHQELCGALSGGVLVIGALLGRTELAEDDRPALNASTLFRARFLAKFGETRCAPLRERVTAPGGLGSCALLIEQSTLLLLELLDEVT
jgi:C_GCAxxG_C_C family probable redox protein